MLPGSRAYVHRCWCTASTRRVASGGGSVAAEHATSSLAARTPDDLVVGAVGRHRRWCVAQASGVVGYLAYEVAPATLTATFVTSAAGIATSQVLQSTIEPLLHQNGLLASLGAGGFLGSYCGARRQRRLPETSLRRLLGLIACRVALRYLQTAVEQTAAPGGRSTAFAPTGSEGGWPGGCDLARIWL